MGAEKIPGGKMTALRVDRITALARGLLAVLNVDKDRTLGENAEAVAAFGVALRHLLGCSPSTSIAGAVLLAVDVQPMNVPTLRDWYAKADADPFAAALLHRDGEVPRGR